MMILSILKFIRLKDLKRARQMLINYTFHPWEGGEGKVVTEYIINNIGLAFQDFQDQQYQKPLSKFENNLFYHQNLVERKLIIVADNNMHYLKGLSYEKMGENKKAKAEYEKATRGFGVISSPLYYND